MKPKYVRAIHPSGYPILLEVEDEDGKLADSLQQLNSWGFRPDIAGDTWVRTPEGNPICQHHNAVMTKREKQGDEWFSHQVTDADGQIFYCRGYPGKSSPGYDVVQAVTPSDNGSKPQAQAAPKQADPPPAKAELPPVTPDTPIGDINDDLFD